MPLVACMYGAIYGNAKNKMFFTMYNNLKDTKLGWDTVFNIHYTRSVSRTKKLNWGL